LTVIVMVCVALQPALVPVTVYVVVEAGTKGTPLVTPPVQLYDAAPVPLNVTEVPAHTVDDGDAVAPTFRFELTVIVMVLVALHPAVVPVTVYVAVEAGMKDTPLVTPPVQLYVVAPVPFNVTDVPGHTVVEGDAVAPTVGIGFTVIVMVLVALHPAKVPVTVYVAVEAGMKGTPLVTPPDQL
jgi:hypothetical protein